MQAATTSPSFHFDPPPASFTTPTHSMPSTLGNCIPGECPCLVNNSERLRPYAFTRISTWPSFGLGSGWSVVYTSSEGAMGARGQRTALILLVVEVEEKNLSMHSRGEVSLCLLRQSRRCGRSQRVTHRWENRRPILRARRQRTHSVAEPRRPHSSYRSIAAHAE